MDKGKFLSLSRLRRQRSPSGTSCHLPRIGGVCLAEGAFRDSSSYCSLPCRGRCNARPYRTDCKRTYIKYIRSVTAGSAKPCCFFACFARWLQTACRGIYTVQPPKHPGCLQLVAKFYKQLKITYLCNILNCFSSCRVLSTRVRTRWSIAQQCRGPARARTKLRSCLCAPGESCCFPAASRVPRSASSLH